VDLPIPQRSQLLVPRMQTKLGTLRKKTLLRTVRAQVLLSKAYEVVGLVLLSDFFAQLQPESVCAEPVSSGLQH